VCVCVCVCVSAINGLECTTHVTWRAFVFLFYVFFCGDLEGDVEAGGWCLGVFAWCAVDWVFRRCRQAAAAAAGVPEIASQDSPAGLPATPLCAVDEQPLSRFMFPGRFVLVLNT